MASSRSSRHPAGSTRHLYVVGSRNPVPEKDAYWRLSVIVGGLDILWTLDAEPVPDEPFDWSGVELRDRPYVAEVLALSDACCDDLFDHEFRTIARRILARVAARDPRPLRRSTNAARSAAGLVWLAVAGNRDRGPVRARSSAGLWAWFGVSNASERGRVLRLAAGLGSGLPPGGPLGRAMTLGDPALLHSRFRAQLIARRDLIADLPRLIAEAGVKPGVVADGPVATVLTPHFGGSRPA